MDEVNPVKLLVKVPIPDPSLVIVPEVVGLDEVPYATPRIVTGAPPSWVTSPPVVALVALIPETIVVETVGITSLRQRTEKP